MEQLLLAQYALSPQGFLVSKNPRDKARLGEEWRGSLTGPGYREVILNVDGKRKSVLVHRLVWFLATGKFPTETIDHIDNNPQNNWLHNLREASYLENLYYAAKPTTLTKVTGVAFFPKRKKPYRLRVRNNGYCYERNYKTLQEACEGRRAYLLSIGVRPEFIRP